MLKSTLPPHDASSVTIWQPRRGWAAPREFKRTQRSRMFTYQERLDWTQSTTSVGEGVVDLPGLWYASECVLAEFAKGDAGTGYKILHRA